MENYNPKISIVTVCYNAVTDINATMESIINQTYKNIEYIIVDGGSTDGTLELIKKFNKRINFLISEQDKGIYDAMNKSLKLASGDFLIFINAGDRLFSLDTIKNAITKFQPDCVNYGDVIMFNKNTSYKYNGEFDSQILAKKNICHQAIFYPKELYKNYQYNLKYKYWADWAYNILAWKKFKFFYINEVISYYALGGISEIRKDYNFRKDYKYLLRKGLGLKFYLTFLWNSHIKSRLHKK